MCGAQLKESKMGILRTKIHGESNVWSTAQRKQDGNLRTKIHGESNVWSTTQRKQDGNFEDKDLR